MPFFPTMRSPFSFIAINKPSSTPVKEAQVLSNRPLYSLPQPSNSSLEQQVTHKNKTRFVILKKLWSKTLRPIASKMSLSGKTLVNSAPPSRKATDASSSYGDVIDISAPRGYELNKAFPTFELDELGGRSSLIFAPYRSSMSTLNSSKSLSPRSPSFHEETVEAIVDHPEQPKLHAKQEQFLRSLSHSARRLSRTTSQEFPVSNSAHLRDTVSVSNLPLHNDFRNSFGVYRPEPFRLPSFNFESLPVPSSPSASIHSPILVRDSWREAFGIGVHHLPSQSDTSLKHDEASSLKIHTSGSPTHSPVGISRFSVSTQSSAPIQSPVSAKPLSKHTSSQEETIQAWENMGAAMRPKIERYQQRLLKSPEFLERSAQDYREQIERSKQAYEERYPNKIYRPKETLEKFQRGQAMVKAQDIAWNELKALQPPPLPNWEYDYTKLPDHRVSLSDEMMKALNRSSYVAGLLRFLDGPKVSPTPERPSHTPKLWAGFGEKLLLGDTHRRKQVPPAPLNFSALASVEKSQFSD